MKEDRMSTNIDDYLNGIPREFFESQRSNNHPATFWMGAIKLYKWLHDHNSKEEVEEQPVLIGHLNKRWGMNGYQPAEIGHEVFLYKDRYQFTLQPAQKGLLPLTVPFYKETLHQAINFLKDG